MHLLILGKDKIGRRAAHEIEKLGLESVTVVIDHSSSPRRIWRLLSGGRLMIYDLCRMIWAEMLRKNYPLPPYAKITGNNDILEILEKTNIEKIWLFRAGLIVSRKLLEKGIPVVNIHCARLPEYGGLGAIPRALRDQQLEQTATLHRVIEQIDGGEVLAVRPYQLNPDASYARNENTAYDAGIHLLKEQISHEAAS